MSLLVGCWETNPSQAGKNCYISPPDATPSRWFSQHLKQNFFKALLVALFPSKVTGFNHPTVATVSLPTDLILEDANLSLIPGSKTLCAEHFDHSPADPAASPKPY